MKKVICVILLIIIVIGVILVLSIKDNNVENKQSIRHVSMDEIVQIMNENENYIILDARTIEEYNEGHIPNAICIPNETIDESVTEQLPKSGNRSKQATTKLANLGYTKLVEFGGIIDWDGDIE